MCIRSRSRQVVPTTGWMEHGQHLATRRANGAGHFEKQQGEQCHCMYVYVICNLTYNNIFHVLSIHLHVSLASLCLFINFWMKVFSLSFVLLFSSLRCLSFCTNPVNSFFIYVFTRNINFIQNPKRITQVYRIYIANNLLHLYSSSFESFEAS